MDLVPALPPIALVLILVHPTVSRLFKLPRIRFHYEEAYGIDAFLTPPVAVPILLRTMARALRIDIHLRNSYYSIYAGSSTVQLPPAGSPEALAFAAHFDNFLSDNLPVVEFVGCHSYLYGWTRRPTPGRHNKVMINYKLARAFERLEAIGHENAARIYVVMACTLMHELAHCYASHCRPGYSPIINLNIAGRTGLIPFKDNNGQEMRDANGDLIMLELGESGYVQEAHFAGSGGRLSVTVPTDWKEDWSVIERVTLQLGKTGQHREISLRECYEIVGRLGSASSTSYKFLEAADPERHGQMRCKAVKLGTATYKSKDWSLLSSVKSRASENVPMLHIGVTGKVTIEPYRGVAARDDE